MRAVRLLLASGGIVFLGCSLLVEASDLDAGCPVGQKLCPDHGCVALHDAAFGCEPDVCVPCEKANAIMGCEEGRCAIESCVFPYGCPDCHANLLTDEKNCGACSEPCEDDGLCADGVCIGN
jgi:hypothetical protein